MNPLKQLIAWGDSHNPRWLAVLRIILGLFIFSRGVTFLTNIDDFQKMVAASNLHITSGFLADIIPWINIAGGFCIIIGLGTRTACVFEMPVVLGAIFYVNTASTIFGSFDTSVPFSILIFILLIVFFVEGSGTLSVTAYAKEENQEDDEHEPPPMI